MEMLGWQDKPEDLLDNFTREAYFGITPLTSKSSLTTITLDDYKIQSLLREFPNQSKAGIVFVVPIQKPDTKKEKRGSRSSNFLLPPMPLPKRQKSPIGRPIQ